MIPQDPMIDPLNCLPCLLNPRGVESFTPCGGDPLAAAYCRCDLPGLTGELMRMARALLVGAEEEEIRAATLHTIFALRSCPSSYGARDYAQQSMVRWILESREPDDSK